MPLLHQGASVAELSRPEQQTKRKFKAKTRKPPGRKATHQPKDATYQNWFTPFLFNQIENARIFAGGPKWSTRAIVKVLKLRDPVVFAKLNRTTIDIRKITLCPGQLWVALRSFKGIRLGLKIW